MDAAIGLGVQPVPELLIDIRKIGKGPQGPEVVADVVDAPFFDLAFFLGLIRMAGPGHDPEGSEKLQEGLVKADEGPLPFGDGGAHVVDYQFRTDASKEEKGVQQGLLEGLLLLGVGELPVKQPAMRFNNRQAVKLPGSLPVEQGAEVAPVHLKLFSRSRFEADIGPFFFRPDLVQVIPEDGGLPGIALGDQPLE